MMPRYTYPSIQKVLSDDFTGLDHLTEQESERYYMAIIEVLLSIPDEAWCSEAWDDTCMDASMCLADWENGASEERKKVLIEAFNKKYPRGFE